MTYEPIIGLEVHAQLRTRAKIFCRCSTQFGAEPNSQVCPVCLGMPGVLPVLNRRAVEFAVRMGLAVDCQIALHSIFARKNYFYPDLPKGYQISQYEEPLCRDGALDIEVNGARKRIGIRRIHLEEDAGKSIHAEAFVDVDETLVDLNRCGVPLIEIVSEPDLRSPEEAAAYISQLRQIVQYLDICDGNMEEGSLRCDANVSVRRRDASTFGVKTELKNMNSIRGVERALAFEIDRQIHRLGQGESVVQETLLWDADRNEAVPMRSKEFAHDYRYFPEPDLVPLHLEDAWVKELRASLPELPLPRKRRFIDQYHLPDYDAGVLTESRALADYFEGVAERAGDSKAASNWIMGEVLRALKETGKELADFPIDPADLAQLLRLIDQGTISGRIAKTVFDEMATTGKDAEAIVREKGLVQISDSDVLERQIADVLEAHPAEVEKYRSGKKQVFGYLVGQVMKATRGKANPKLVNEILRARLEGDGANG